MKSFNRISKTAITILLFSFMHYQHSVKFLIGVRTEAEQIQVVYLEIATMKI